MTLDEIHKALHAAEPLSTRQLRQLLFAIETALPFLEVSQAFHLVALEARKDKHYIESILRARGAL